MVSLRPNRQMTVEVGSDVAVLSDLRDQLRAWLHDEGVAADTVDDLLLVATELGANAIESNLPGRPIEVTLSSDGLALRLSVANHPETPIEEAPELVSGSLQTRGRGLAIVRSLVDTFTLSTSEDRMVVRTVQLL